jgi:DNA (cytosine-5)-methyltransferase 1
MKIIDLFAGVGGLSQGFSKAGFRTALAIEYDPKIAETFRFNHPNIPVIVDDIQNVDIDAVYQKIGQVTGIIGGPPCQGFSQKGQRKSVLDERNFMFHSFIKFVDVFRPSFFVMENVPNITTTEKGFFRKEVIMAFEKLGYKVTFNVLNAADFGIPQLRRRAFFVGYLNAFPMSLPTTNGKRTSVKEAIYDLPFIASGEGENFYEYQSAPQSNYQALLRDNSSGIYNHFATSHSPLALERLAMIPKGAGREVLPKEHRTKSIYSGTWTRLREDEPAVTITTRFDTPSSGMFTHPILNRCLTVREAARIQSFDDTFIFTGNKTSQMKQVGNAVPPLLAYEVAKIVSQTLN